MTADYHVPGQPILGANPDTGLGGMPPVAEKTIVMDDLLISSAFVYDLDETLAHYSLRSEISAKIGHAMAEAYDKKIFRTIALAAREAHPITASPGPEPGGSIIRLGANNEYDAQALVDAFFEAASILDEKNMPKAGRTAVLFPASTTHSFRRPTLTSLTRILVPLLKVLSTPAKVSTPSLAFRSVVPTTCLSWLVL